MLSQAHDSLIRMQTLSQKLQKLLLPDGKLLSELLEQDEVCLQSAESEEVMQQLDKANVKLANALQNLMQVRHSASCSKRVWQAG